MSDEFRCYLKECGIKSESTAAYSPQQNGVSKRLNRTLVEAARSMLSHAGLSNAYWAEAIATATCLRNRMVSAAIKSGQTPYQLWYGKKLNLNQIRVFGCTVYVYIPDGDRKKLDKKAQKLRFINYTETAGNYKVWDDKKQKWYVRHYVIFNENDFSMSQDTPQHKPEVPSDDVHIELENQEEKQVEDKTREQSEPIRQSQRTKKEPVRYGLDEFADTAKKAIYVGKESQRIEEPTTIKDALSGSHSKEWKLAADQEYSSLMENKTRELVKLPKGRETVGCKWVFRVKYDRDGKIQCFKGRLVAQGFTQRYSIDYEEIFSPVAQFSTIHTLLAYAVERKMQVHQMNIVSAF